MSSGYEVCLTLLQTQLHAPMDGWNRQEEKAEAAQLSPMFGYSNVLDVAYGNMKFLQ